MAIRGFRLLSTDSRLQGSHGFIRIRGHGGADARARAAERRHPRAAPGGCRPAVDTFTPRVAAPRGARARYRTRAPAAETGSRPRQTGRTAYRARDPTGNAARRSVSLRRGR